MINLQPEIQSAMVAADRLGEILDLEKEKAVNEDKKINAETLLGNIELNNIDFRYGTRKLILHNINISIKPGEKVYIELIHNSQLTLVPFFLRIISAARV